MLYILSKTDLSIKDYIRVSNYSIENNISLKGRMTFTLHRLPIAEKGDLIKYEESIGIIDKITSSKDSVVYTIQVNDIHSLFDRDIILTNESLISSTGIEDFISQIIYDRFTDSSDTLLNIPYLTTSIGTHTPLNITVDTNNSIYNFMSFLALAKRLYGIDLVFTIPVDGALSCSIEKHSSTEIEIDLNARMFVSVNTVYSEDIIAKVTIYSLETSTEFDYFLLSDGTITTTSSDPNRVIGETTTIYVQTDAEVAQKAIDTFKDNSFIHNISFSLVADNDLYETELFKVNNQLKVKTPSNGVFSTYIAKVVTSMKSSVIQVECGNTKVYLTDILKGAL